MRSFRCAASQSLIGVGGALPNEPVEPGQKPESGNPHNKLRCNHPKTLPKRMTFPEFKATTLPLHVEYKCKETGHDQNDAKPLCIRRDYWHPRANEPKCAA